MKKNSKIRATFFIFLTNGLYIVLFFNFVHRKNLLITISK